jgi:hypothetical protein
MNPTNNTERSDGGGIISGVELVSVHSDVDFVKDIGSHSTNCCSTAISKLSVFEI